VGGIYVGAYYGGTFWANGPSITYEEKTDTWLGTPDKKDVKIYPAIPSLDDEPKNLFSVLIGIADMGFRASLYTTRRSFSDNDFFDDANNDSYKSYESVRGSLRPQIVWAMAKDLTPNGIRPYVGADYGMNTNYKKYTQYVVGTWVAGDDIIEDSNNSTDIVARAGLGGYTLLDNDGFRFSADLDYVFVLTSYDNEYNYINSSGDRKVQTGFKGRIIGGNFTEESSTGHTITPSVSGSWSGEDVAFSFKVNLPVGLSSSAVTEMDFSSTGDGKLVKDGEDKTVSALTFNPNVQLAAQWKIIPKIALNLGGRINLNSLARTTTEGQTFTDGKSDDNSSYKEVATTKPASIGNSLAAGFTFNITDNATFEVASGAKDGFVDVFGTTTTGNAGSLLYFTNLLVSLKY
jgi:hypothetical protein